MRIRIGAQSNGSLLSRGSCVPLLVLSLPLLPALASGEVDAASVHSPSIQQMQRALGDGGLLLTDERDAAESVSLVGTPLVRERP
jgi:hypothetical protein